MAEDNKEIILVMLKKQENREIFYKERLKYLICSSIQKQIQVRLGCHVRNLAEQSTGCQGLSSGGERVKLTRAGVS